VVDGELAAFNATTGKIIKGTGGRLAANLVAGPASSVSGRTTYGDTTGKLIADGGVLATDVVTGPATSVDGDMVLFSGTTGKVVKVGRAHRVLYSNATDTPVSSASDTLVYGYTLPAGLLSQNGDAIRMTCGIVSGGDASTKNPTVRWAGVDYGICWNYHIFSLEI
jgi:hypothetical protein